MTCDFEAEALGVTGLTAGLVPVDRGGPVCET